MLATEEAQKWHPELIKAAIRMRGKTLSQLATENGLHESLCRASLCRRQPEADRVISRFLDVPLCELWPDRYDAGGGQIRHERVEATNDRAGKHRQIDAAA